ncbi:hypothetical protein CVT24_005406 [Panaeolus cyanescens]|uniref:Glycosyl transferase CAP10 domain-containing protein n=1 Tax=Panaeolus cyanescens TaxID=181874 RepID=A0A409Y8W6_9AGAR|nr:hypothetical protein CVT24_005406 [Panaeolus cyanescens]
MLWPTDSLYASRRRRIILHPTRTREPRPLRLSRRASVTLILFLITVIILLSRTLGNIARDLHRDQQLGLERNHQTPTYAELERDARDARDIRRKMLLLRKRIDDLGIGIWTEDGGSTGYDYPERTQGERSEREPKQGNHLHYPVDEEMQLETDHADINGVLDTHIYRHDGLLEVNPDGPHPIYELTRRSEKQWAEKHRRASKTLKQAVQEYRRRYGRLPPTGFDMWWDYVQKNRVLLPDEYDQIHEDLAPFWGVDPRDLQATQREQEAQIDTFTIGKKSWIAPISLLNFSFSGEGGLMSDHVDAVQSPQDPDGRLRPQRPYITKRSDLPKSLSASPRAHTYNQHLNGAFNIFDMLADVQDHIPPFRAVFSPHDNPSLLRDWKNREEALKAAQMGKGMLLGLDVYLVTSAAILMSYYPSLVVDIRPIEHSPANLLGWRAACAPDSPARRQRDPILWDNPSPFSTIPLPQSSLDNPKKTFIHLHDATTDPCMHPSHLLLHGQFISHRKGPVPERRGGGFIPMFSYSPTRLHNDITVAVGEGSQYSSPFPEHRTEEDEGGFGMDNDREEEKARLDIDALLEMTQSELEHALDLDTDARLLWRGSNTGMWHAARRGWERSQRSRLVFWAGGGEGAALWGSDDDAERDVDAGFGGQVDLRTARAFGAGLGETLALIVPPSNVYSTATSSKSKNKDDAACSVANSTVKRRPVGPLAQVKKSRLAPGMLDIAFTASNSEDGGVGPLNCAKTTCETLRKVFEWRRRMEMKEASKYRFVMDVDGNGWSSRLRKLLVGPSLSSQRSLLPYGPVEERSNLTMRHGERWDRHFKRRRLDDSPSSLVFKSTIYKEWWFDRSQAWVHYVPVQVGLHDLWDVLIFFRGKLGEEVET